MTNKNEIGGLAQKLQFAETNCNFGACPLSERSSLIKLFFISFVSLFFELLYIRWIPDAVHILGFFGNFTLLAVFLGLGIGLALPPKELDQNKIFGKIIFNLFILSAVILFFDALRFGVTFSGEYAFNEDYFTHNLKINIHVIITFFLALTIYTFIPIGYLINLLFRNQKPLTAYSVNIAGSLVGIVLFSVVSYLGMPVWAWMAVGMLALLPFARKKYAYIAVIALACAVIFSANDFNEKNHNFKKVWSPYYALRFSKASDNHYYICIGNSFILSGYNMYAPSERGNMVRKYYEFPYRFKKSPESVLVLGSGMGNDICAALKNGAKHIDAVEIDPQITRLGKKFHPFKPYDDKRVNVITGDARTFIKNTNKKYDLIIFGTLDSHGLFSHLSSIKMENYVYTLESFQATRRILKGDGILYVNTGTFNTDFVSLRLFYTITEAFGEEPVFCVIGNSITMYIAGDIAEAKKTVVSQGELERKYVDHQGVARDMSYAAIVPTDDWPQLFLKEKKIPSDYLYALMMLFVISAVFVWFYFGKAKNLNLNYFFLGAGFMLLETKSITEMGLVFGTTWFVNSVVIASILLIILLVNLVLIKYEKFNNMHIMYLLLAIALVCAYLFPLSKLNIPNFYVKILCSILFICLPICFASFIFGMNFRNAGGKTTIYLASNMLGAVFGGITEYASMIYGLKMLYIFALAMYFVALLAMIKGREC